jgi:starch synthase
VSLFLPLYRSIREAGFEAGPVERELGPSELGVPATAAIRSMANPTGPRVFLVDAPELFDRIGLYGDESGDYPDNLLRYSVLCRAALCAIDEVPDILHVHDWQTALTPVLLRAGLPPGAGALAAEMESGPGPRTVLTLHNLAYQGRFPREDWPHTGLPDSWFGPDRLEYYGGINLLKGGIVAADRVTTVSPTYAREISTPEFGFGLEGVIGGLPAPVAGILNGIDTGIWSPENDQFLPERYDARDRSGKASSKGELQRDFSLAVDPYVPLFGFVSRLVDQKGMPLIESLAERFRDWPAQFVFLGSGEPRYEQLIERIAASSGNVGARVAFSERLAHLIEAGSDFFLMPSAFEPCGLNQMISQNYGTIPIVHAVGGLADSVVALNDESLEAGTATGIVFRSFDPESLEAAIDRSIDLFAEPTAMDRLIRAGMAADFSWDSSGREYEKLYEEMMQGTHD